MCRPLSNGMTFPKEPGPLPSLWRIRTPPPGTWVHWVIYDIPSDAVGLEEGISKKEALPNGAKQGLAWGVESFSRVGYSGPCPPPGAPHRYNFKLYALDAMLNLAPKATKFDVEKAMKGHVLGQTELMGKFGR